MYATTTTDSAADLSRIRPSAVTELPLLTVEDLAKLLHRTPSAVRQALNRDSEFSAQLRGTRVKLGRRIYFRRDMVEKMIDDATGC